MKPIAAIFQSHAEAERAAHRLTTLGVAHDRMTVLSPGDRVRGALPTDEGEATGTGAAIGAVAGGATGAAVGMPLGAAISLMVPGVGPIIALGVIGAALFGAGGAAVGSALETTLTQGVPRDDVFLYEDALARGLSVVVVLAEEETLAERARSALKDAGGVDVDDARDRWWTALREEERGPYTVDEETAYRRGFEAGVRRESRPPAADIDAAVRRGWERGRAYRERADAQRFPKSA
jgi:hypothetical protein